MFQDISSKKNFFKIFQTDRKILTCHLVCCNFSKSQGGKIQILLELSYHSHLKKEGMTAAIADHRRRGGRSKPYYGVNGLKLSSFPLLHLKILMCCHLAGYLAIKKDHLMHSPSRSLVRTYKYSSIISKELKAL